MFISPEEATRRLNSSKNLTQLQPSSVPPVTVPKENKPAPENLKTLAASLVAQGVSEKEVCKQMNVSREDLRSANEQRVQNSIEKVRNLALDRMLIALGLMTPDKMEEATIKELSLITGNLSKVIGQTSPKEINDNRVQFIMHAPEQRTLTDYKVIDV